MRARTFFSNAGDSALPPGIFDSSFSRNLVWIWGMVAIVERRCPRPLEMSTTVGIRVGIPLLCAPHHCLLPYFLKEFWREGGRTDDRRSPSGGGGVTVNERR